MRAQLYRVALLNERNLCTQIRASKQLRSTSTFPTNSTPRTAVSIKRAPFSTIRRSLASASTSSSTGKTKRKTKTAGDIFLDNLGTVFLSAIGILVLSLVRSSQGTSNKNNLRKQIECRSALDPFEIDDLRVSNDQLTPSVFREIYKILVDEHGWRATDKVDYKIFVSAVMQAMKDMKGDSFTIELGFLIDRVVAAILEDGNMFGAVNKEGKITFTLLLVILSLAVNGPPRERIEILYDILKNNNEWSEGSEPHTTSSGIREEDVVDMVGFLQKSCQLVPDAQIIEADTKYPIQEYKVASPVEMVFMGKTLKKEVLSDDALREDGKETWSCDDFHHLLRSRSVCVWGECYVKKKSLA